MSIIQSNMKSYTDIEQGKKLAEILPLESADMYYMKKDEEDGNEKVNHFNIPILIEPYVLYPTINEDIPCWSLAALLEIIRKPTALDLLIDGRGCRCHCRDKQEGKFYGTDDYCDNAIDACVEVIIQLHEQKVL